MDDGKKDLHKSKRSKSEVVKGAVQLYLQKRNYSLSQVENVSAKQQITYSKVDSKVRNPNSILYGFYNSDPMVIENNFENFVTWMNDLIEKCPTLYQDMENLVGPLFCHFYLDILNGGHTDQASQFFKKHSNSVNLNKCDQIVSNLINSINNNEIDSSSKEEQFRSNKFTINLSEESIAALKKFVQKKCHFLHILQSWFDFNDDSDDEECTSECMNVVIKKTNKYQRLQNVIDKLKKAPNNVVLIGISNVKERIHSAILNRKSGLIVFDQVNSVILRPIHTYDSILGYEEKQIIMSDHIKRVNTITISQDYTKLATGSSDYNLCIYDLITMTLIRICKGHIGPIYATAISSNNIYVASASQDQTARLWNSETGNCLRLFVGHTQAVTCLDFHPNCLYLITGSSDKSLRLFCLDDGSPGRLFCGLKGAVLAVAIHPLGTLIASASDDRKVRIWDILTTKVILDLKHRGEPITKLKWSACGKQICGAGVDGTVRVWELNLFKENSEKSSEKSYEPIANVKTQAFIYDLEYEYGSFACLISKT